jgi:hypothetical protein
VRPIQIPQPGAPAAASRAQKIVKRIDLIPPETLLKWAKQEVSRWEAEQPSLKKSLRLRARIQHHLQKLTVEEFACVLRRQKYAPSTIRQYAFVAASLTPGYKETPVGRALFSSLDLWVNQRKLEQPDEGTDLSLEQIRLLLTTGFKHLRAAVWITYITASRVGDWAASELTFHGNLVEIRYERRWKSDKKLNRRLSKWIPRGTDSEAMWREGRAFAIASPEAVGAHVKQQTGRTGHALRHAAIKRLQVLGQKPEDIAHLTFHTSTERHPVLERFYFTIWAPPEAHGSKMCAKMAGLLMRSMEW